MNIWARYLFSYRFVNHLLYLMKFQPTGFTMPRSADALAFLNAGCRIPKTPAKVLLECVQVGGFLGAMNGEVCVG